MTTNLTAEDREDLKDILGWHEWMCDALERAIEAEPKMPMPWYSVRTDHFCGACGDDLYAGEVSVIKRTHRYHFDCTLTTSTTNYEILPPNKDWLGWTDHDRWVREYASKI